MEYKFASDVSLEKHGGGRLDSFNTDLRLYPRFNEIQDPIFINLDSNPEAKMSRDNTIKYEWDNYSPVLRYSLTSNVRTTNKLYQIPQIQFPISNLPKEILPYKEPTKNIDVNTAIINKAQELVEGETELSSAVQDIAIWIEDNIEYDLNTLTAPVSLPSTWVFTNRYGVCDEMTSLFISMLRSVGIPARFISGMVYTNTDYNFGNHGWAEVYFPGYGWVPYDVTFGQHGWIDPSHIKLDESLDSADPAVNFNWRSNGITAKPGNLVTSSKILEKGDEINPIFLIKIEALQHKVGPNSFVPVEVSVKNPFNSYVHTTLTITKAPGLEEDNIRPILLGPNQEKKEFWIAKTPGDVDPKFVYQTKLEVVDTFGSFDSTSLEYSNSYDTFTIQEAQQQLALLEEKEEKTYSRLLEMECNPNRSYYYINEKIEINCNLINKGNTQLNELIVCIKEECKSLNVLIGQQEFVKFEFDTLDETSLRVNAKNAAIDLDSYVSIRIFSEPDLRILNPELPEVISYNSQFLFSFILASEVLVKDVKVMINDEVVSSSSESKGPNEINLSLFGKDFSSGRLTVDVEYKDEYDNPYILSGSYELMLSNVPFYIKIINAMKNLF